MSRKTPESPDGPENPEPVEYEVGYARPPKHTRFKPGQSGNPRGRPSKPQTLAAQVRAALAQKVRVSENGRYRKLPKSEIIATGLVNRAAKGSLRDAAMLVQLMKSSEAEQAPDEAAAQVDADAKAIIDLYVRTHYSNEGGDA